MQTGKQLLVANVFWQFDSISRRQGRVKRELAGEVQTASVRMLKFVIPGILRSAVFVRGFCILGAIGAGLLIYVPGTAQTQPPPKADIAPITAALRVKDFDKAIDLSKTALQRSPSDPQLWALLGIALASKGNSKEALAAFEQSLKISPNYPAALAGAAQIHYQLGNKEAIPLLNRLLQLRPDDPTSHAMLAVLEYRQGNCEAAVPHFERAGSLLESQIEAQHAYGTCLVRLHKLDAAAKVFEHTAELNPDDRRERLLLASVQVMAKKPHDAVATLEPLLQANPGAETLELASTAYEDSGDTPNAVATLQKALLLDPRNINLYLDFASISMAHQSFQVGIDVMTDGIKLQPQASQLYLARGVLYVQLAQYDKAEADFTLAHELDPSQSLSSAAQGLAAAQQNDLDTALAAVQKKLAAKPNDAYLLYLQADFLSQKASDAGSPEFQTALRSGKKAVALQPSLAAARGVLAKLYMQSGQYQQAIVECRKAIASDPKDQTTVYRLIQALRKTGKKDEIPPLLKQLAKLRQDATREERERNRYKLVEGDAKAENSGQP